MVTVVAGGVAVRGEAVDDAGAPLPKQRVLVQALEGGQNVAMGPSEPCPSSSHNVQGTGAMDGSLETDDRGDFCGVYAKAPKGATVRVAIESHPLVDGASIDVAPDSADAERASTILRFEPAPDVLDLDRDTVTITAQLHVARDALARFPADAIKREGQLLTLEDERGKKLAEGTTGGDGRVKFEIATSLFDGPGEGALTTKFAGAPPLAKAIATAEILRRADATIALEAQPAKGDPEEGIPIDVRVTSKRGDVDGGVVEALRGSESVGTGPVERGHARVVASFGAGGKPTAAITLRYVPSMPWWHPGAPVAVDLQLAGPGFAKEILFGAFVLAIAAWVVMGWRRAPKPKTMALETTMPPSGRAGVQVMGPPSTASGYRGVVVDAHDGAPIARAELTIVVPSFEGSGIAARALADEDGAFVLEPSDPHAVRGDARLVVEAEHHARYEEALPPPSTLSVALVTRRRALLERLVKWARRQGAPYDAPPEPTPGHVRRAAARAQAETVEAWARRVEAAAFGPAAVDAEREREVRAEEPK